MKYFLLTTAVLYCLKCYSQSPANSDSAVHNLFFSSNLLVASSEHTPYWMTGNNSQRLSAEMGSQLYGQFLAYKKVGQRPLDYHYGLEIIGNFNGRAHGQVVQSYIGINNRTFSLTLGKMEEAVSTIFNEQLGFGNLLNGNNALPIPKISFKTNGWIKAPFLSENLSFSGYFAHGWFEKGRYQSQALLHQKWFHLSLHSKSKEIKLQFGLTHNAQWGGFNSIDESRQPAGFKNYLKILSASSGGSDASRSDQSNALGNHLGSWDLKGQIKVGNFFISNYWQFLWEDSSGLTPFNWRDGKVGLTLSTQNSKAIISRFNIEIVRTNDQDADKVSKDGVPIFEPDNFLNNATYRSGWTYMGNVIGSPIFLLLNPDSESSKSRVKNMINGVNVSIAGNINGFIYKISYRGFKNSGTRYELIEPSLGVSSVIVYLTVPTTNGSFSIQGEYDWGNWLGKNLGLQFQYRVNFARIFEEKN